MIRSLFTASAVMLATPLMSQTPPPDCNTYEVAQESLSTQYGEYVVWEGLVSNNLVVVQLWVNPETGTWTHLVVSPDGIACVVSDGLNYTFVDPPIPGDDM